MWRKDGMFLWVIEADGVTKRLKSDGNDELLTSLNELVEKGHSVIVIEHNLDVIKTADYIIDLGPEGGHKGGKLMAVGTPEQVAKSKKSHTGRFLKDHLS